jgi:glycosyltransferase involved in cell wall biosynthesis
MLMKINLIIFISEFNYGGAGNSLFRLCQNLPKNIYNINVICLKSCAYEKELKRNNIKLFKINSDKTSFAMFKVKKIVENLISNKFKKNIFVSNIYYSNILSILFLRSLNMKIILIERTPFQELEIYFDLKDLIKKKIMKFLIGLTYQYADLCISNSKFISNKYNLKYNLKFKTIYPPSFLGRINFNNKKNKNKKLCFGTVCRLSKEKGLLEFIKIIKKLNFNFKFIIIGNGPEKNTLKKLSVELGISDKIIFLGFLNLKEVSKQLKNFDVFINCSYFEGFPNSVVESLANGIPVLASQSHGGINEIINGKRFGYIYKNDNDLISKLSNFNKIKKKNMLEKKKIINHLKKFSLSENIKNYSKVFQNI